MNIHDQVIVFYDGDCGLCQRSIRILANIDKSHLLRFAPQNGETYKLICGETPSLKNSVLVFYQGTVYQKSRALIKLGELLKGPYQFCSFFKIIPMRLLDFFYDQVAKRRHYVSCILITRDHRFLK